jgi:hypothetical protein
MGSAFGGLSGAWGQATAGMRGSGMLPADQGGGDDLDLGFQAPGANTYRPKPPRRPPSSAAAEVPEAPQAEAFRATDPWQDDRRERAQSHGSLREARGLPEPESPETTPLPSAHGGMEGAAEAADPARQRRRQRAEDDGQNS